MAWQPISLAKDLCCNCKDGVCLGDGYRLGPEKDRKGTTVREVIHFRMRQGDELLEQRPCRLGTGKQCTFFDKYVLPIVLAGKLDKRDLKRRESARAAYISRFPIAGHTGDRRFCECGQPMQKRRRFCDDCRKAHRKQTKRTNRATSHRPSGQLTENAIPEVPTNT